MRTALRTFIEFVVAATISVAFGILIAVIVIEWMAGCGETYVDANGERHQYECVFIPQPKTN